MQYGANPTTGAGLSWMIWITHKIYVVLFALAIPHAREVLTEGVRVIWRVSLKHATSTIEGRRGFHGSTMTRAHLEKLCMQMHIEIRRVRNPSEKFGEMDRRYCASQPTPTPLKLGIP